MASESANIKQTAAAIITLGVLGLAVLFAVTLAIMMLTGTFGYFPEDDYDAWGLYFPWRLFNELAFTGTALSTSLAAFAAILSLGAQFLATLHRRLWSVLLICGVALLGLVSAVILFLWIDNPDPLATLRGFSDLPEATDEDYLGAARPFLGWSIAWFGAFAAGQLGISSLKPQGFFRKLYGGGDDGGEGDGT